MNESDWRIFKEIKDQAIELFCQRSFAEFEEIISNNGEHIHNRYLHLSKLVRNHDKQMSFLFDGHSRSKAWLQLIAIRANGLANDDLVNSLTDEFKEKTNPDKLAL